MRESIHREQRGRIRDAVSRVRERLHTGGDDEGSDSVELSIIIPIVLMLIFASVQWALWWLGRQAVLAAAQSAARAESSLQASADAGQSSADDFLANKTFVDSHVVAINTTPTSVTVTIHATVDAVIPVPGYHPSIDVTITRPREHFSNTVAP